MAKIAFLGLGQMGAPMAARLLDADHEVTVWNRTREKAEPLGRRGARIASTPDESIAGADVAITMLTDRDAVERVVFGRDGLSAALEPRQTLIESLTIALVGGALGVAAESRLHSAVGVSGSVYAMRCGLPMPGASSTISPPRFCSPTASDIW